HVFLEDAANNNFHIAGAQKQQEPPRRRKAMAKALLTADAARSLVGSVDAFLFDCDGVIWKGDELIQGVPETLELLRKLGKKLVFVTNNSRKSRRQYSKKFKTLGLEVTEEEIFTSSFAAAMFLKLNNFSPEKKVYVVGEDGILDELKLAGFECFGGPEDGKKNIMLEANFYFDHDKNVGAVVVGLDQYFNYYKMQYASLCIRENPGCLFIATNRDPTGHMTSAQEWPGFSIQKCQILILGASIVPVHFLIALSFRSWNYGCCSKLLGAERAYCCWKTFKLFDGLPIEKLQFGNVENVHGW
uniref:phosphoglycolate phosphatase n=1 Tax=Aegilops tauschii subsp. strangulata TaxID=200361 RepID=A0A453KIK3_AEGTS